MNKLKIFFIVVMLLEATAATAQSTASPDAITADTCTPQPKCRSMYTTMEPAHSFHSAMMMHHRMMHHHQMHHRM